MSNKAEKKYRKIHRNTMKREVGEFFRKTKKIAFTVIVQRNICFIAAVILLILLILTNILR